MSKVEDFLTAAQEQEVIEAIRKAELQTSGEIRVHIEKHTDKEVVERASEVFHWLKMDLTEQHNGVLIYVAVEDRTFAIYGDKGINAVVPKDFWASTRTKILEHFKKGDFTTGLVEGIAIAGEQLQQHFPWVHGDENELPDDVTYG